MYKFGKNNDIICIMPNDKILKIKLWKNFFWDFRQEVTFFIFVSSITSCVLFSNVLLNIFI